MTKETLDNLIKQCVNALRTDDGISGSVHYTEVLSWILFLKFFSDKEKERADEAEFNFEEYEHVLEEKYRWENWAISKELTGEALITFVNEELIPYLQTLKSSKEKDLRNIISNIFKEVTNRVHSGYILKDVLGLIDRVQFNISSEVFTLSHVYESLLQNMGNDGGNSGEFYTPRPLVHFIVDMLDPKIGETVFDPASGSCGFLAEAFEHMKTSADTDQKVNILSEDTFYGNEKTPLPYLLGVMNMILHGVDFPRISKTNTLMRNIRDITEEEKHDVILANPPFGGKEQKMIQKNFPVEAQATELLFMQYIMKMLKFNGRAGVVIPEGILFRSDNAYQEVKKELIETFNVHTVVSLPAGIFLPYSNVKTSVLFFDKTKKTDSVWFYELPLLNGKKLTKKSGISHEHFEEISRVFKERPETEHSWNVEVSKIVENEYNLSANKYNPHQAKEEVLEKPEVYAAEIKKLLTSALQDIEALAALIKEGEKDE